ncbi:flavodoxin [Secundilactobacillus paracollinoides]|uniref:flavodoxin n=1 Tax=Secundilactobacillus paracollinoides TaxID=240427 RepID=UPI0006D00197|nr:flavodoxin [Secundilactobacillus paracollinoides]
MATKILIAYFSHWGHSQNFAEQIQKLTGGDLFEIKTSTDYPEAHDPCSIQAHQEQLADFRPELTNHVQNMAQYTTVLIGHPIWWYREPMVIRSFWEAYNFTDKKVIPFATSGDVALPILRKIPRIGFLTRMLSLVSVLKHMLLKTMFLKLKNG